MDLSLRHLKGRKTTEKPKLPQPPPHILSRTVLFTININYISILSKQILSKLCKKITPYKHLTNSVYRQPMWFRFSLWMPLLDLCLGNWLPKGKKKYIIYRLSALALWKLMHLGTWCMDMVITRRAHCSHDCVYILRPSCFCEIWALWVSWITYDHLYIGVFIQFNIKSWCGIHNFHVAFGIFQCVNVPFTSWPVWAKILKYIFSAGPELWHTIFWPNMAHLPWNRLFWKKLVIWFWSTSWPLSLCTSFFKKT